MGGLPMEKNISPRSRENNNYMDVMMIYIDNIYELINQDYYKY